MSADRWGKGKKEEQGPMTPAAFDAAVRGHIAAGGVQTPSGWIKIPTGIPFPQVRDAVVCPDCRQKKMGVRPHQGDQLFCFGCGRVDTRPSDGGGR